MRTVLWPTQVFPREEGDIFGGFLLRLARELPARGWKPVVVAPSAAGLSLRSDLDGVPIRRFRYARSGRETLGYSGGMHLGAMRHPLGFARFCAAFRQGVSDAVREETPSLVHAHWWFPSGWAAAGAARRAGVPLALSLHGTDLRLGDAFPGARIPARRVMRRASLLLPVSPALDRVLVRWGLAEVAREILPMPADGLVFHPPESGTDRSAFVLAARLTRQKCVDVALRAVRGSADKGVDLTLDIVGDGPERDRLEALAGELEIRDRVVFSGAVPQTELANRFRSSRAVLLVSREEGYGLTLVEGALCEAPSIGTRSGGIPDFVEDGHTGLLVEPGDSEGLSCAMCRLSEDPARARRFGAAARERALERTAGPLADRLAGLYDDLAQRSSSRA
ncbi:MAG: glycosyltransferase [Gemmatimonadota bacterium]|nr:glycosyltransferase [Gemmatimonadota bacterium]MDP7031728.1 glycosyltransferase [Gemmatimonadota bacterium]